MKLTNMTTYQAGLLQARSYRRLKRFMAEQLAPYDLTMMQWSLLGHIRDYGNEGVRTSVLADVFDTQTSLMTNMVNELEKRELVYRTVDPDDSRARKVCVTSEGAQFVLKVEQELRAAMREWLGGINRKHLYRYIQVMQTIADKK